MPTDQPPGDLKAAIWTDIAEAYGEARAYSCLTLATIRGGALIPKTWWAHEHLNLPEARAIIRRHGLTLVPPPLAHRAAPRVEYGRRR